MSIFSLRRRSIKSFGVSLISLIFASTFITPVIWAVGSLTVTPQTNLSNGQSISVSGSGFAASSEGSILECNSDPNQPTVTVAGNQVPVSCTNPLSTLVSTSSSGALPTTTFVVHTGTVGPPGTGTDSSNGSAATDAAKYPCPPTAAQIAAGDSCEITFGDANNDDVSQNISFASQSAPAATPTAPAPAAPSTPATTTTPTTAKVTPLVNTGPGNTVLLFAITFITASLMRYGYLTYRSKKS